MSNTDGERTLETENADASAQSSQSQVDSSTSTGNASEKYSDEAIDKSFSETLKDLQSKQSKLERSIQSTKDKGISELRKELREVKQSIIAMSQLGTASSDSSSQQGNVEQSRISKSVRDMFVDAGFAETPEAVENTPEYLELIKSGIDFNDGVGTLSKAYKHIQEKRRPAKPLDTGAPAQSPGEPIAEGKVDLGLAAARAAAGLPT